MERLQKTPLSQKRLKSILLQRKNKLVKKKEQQSSKKVSTQPSIFEKEEEEEVLILNDIKEKSGIDEEPLILDNPHQEEKSFSQVSKVKQKSSVSPAARKMATEKNIDLDKVRGSGKHGLILKEDVMSLMGVKPAPSERKVQHGPEERIKMTRLRATIAKD